MMRFPLVAVLLLIAPCFAKAGEPPLVSVQQIAESPYTLRGLVLALAPPASNQNFTKSEISEGVYELKFFTSSRTVVVKLTQNQLAAILRSWELYVELVNEENFDHTVRLRALGNNVVFRRQWTGAGFENIPARIEWK